MSDCIPFIFRPIAEDNNTMTGDIRIGESATVHSPVLLILHGFKGFKDWGFFPYVAEYFALEGFITITVNFSLNGYRPNSDRIEAPEDFHHNTISREIQETLALIEALQAGTLHPSLHEYANNPLYILGHSRGGGIALAAAARSSHIMKAVIWNSVATFDRFTPRQKQLWAESGAFPVENARTGQALSLGLEYLQDITENELSISPVAMAAQLHHTPLLIVHAEQDMTVPLREAHKLLYSSSARAQLHVIARTGHTFGAVHPFQGSTPALDEALAVTTDFLKQ